MDDAGNIQRSSSTYNRYADETSLGKNNIRFDFFHDLSRFGIPLDNAERIGKVFYIEVAAEFPCRNSVIGNLKIFNQSLFDSVIRADVVDFVAQLLQVGEQRNIWCYMTGSSTAGQNNFLSHYNPLYIIML